MDASDPPAHRSATDVDTPLGLAFPDGFAWGAATSAYQIEGAATEDGRGDVRLGHVQPHPRADPRRRHRRRRRRPLPPLPRRPRPDEGAGPADYRFSIAWPRIMPDGTGAVNQRGLDFYRRLVDGLHERGIAPMATLFHWDLPQALQDQGGWESRDGALPVRRLRRAPCSGALGDRVPTWLTINEPKTVVQNGYLSGHHAPGLATPDAAYVVAHHLLLGPRPGRAGVPGQPARRAGSARRSTCTPSYPADDSAAAAAAAGLLDGYENRLYLDPIFTGSYPERRAGRPRRRTAGWCRRSATGPRDHLLAGGPARRAVLHARSTSARDGDDVTAAHLARRAGSRSTPRAVRHPDPGAAATTATCRITITENGLPRRTSPTPTARWTTPERIAFLRDHFAAAHRAIADGRAAGELPRVVAAGQLRVGRGLRRAVGPGLRGLRHPASDPEAQRALVPGGHRPQRGLGTTSTVLSGLAPAAARAGRRRQLAFAAR